MSRSIDRLLAVLTAWLGLIGGKGGIMISSCCLPAGASKQSINHHIITPTQTQRHAWAAPHCTKHPHRLTPRKEKMPPRHQPARGLKQVQARHRPIDAAARACHRSKAKQARRIIDHQAKAKRNGHNSCLCVGCRGGEKGDRPPPLEIEGAMTRSPHTHDAMMSHAITQAPPRPCLDRSQQ